MVRIWLIEYISDVDYYLSVRLIRDMAYILKDDHHELFWSR